MLISSLIFVDDYFNDNRLLWFKEWSQKDMTEKYKSIKLELRKRWRWWFGEAWEKAHNTFTWVPQPNAPTEETLEEWTLVPESEDELFWSEIPSEQTIQHAQYFSIWVQNIHLVSPLQILTEAQRENKSGILPVLKSTDKVLSQLSKPYATWLIGVKNSERKVAALIKSRRKSGFKKSTNSKESPSRRH